MQKATREAKQQTSWVSHNKEFEESLDRFIERTLGSDGFIADLERFVGRILGAGRINSLAQTLAKYTAPGVPDLYQGSELWDLSLVDPDNRRPVDYERRRMLLKELDPLPCAEAAALALSRFDEGLPKLWTIHRALHLRQRKAGWFGAAAAYLPLGATGARSHHAVAYLRGSSVATIVPRLPYTLAGEWGDTTVSLPEGIWVNELTGEELPGGRASIAAVLANFPVALLTRKEE
jgi:(1->4)-alpha-D-glucan 1-alpha-D-glucosylmutase